MSRGHMSTARAGRQAGSERNQGQLWAEFCSFTPSGKCRQSSRDLTVP